MSRRLSSSRSGRMLPGPPASIIPRRGPRSSSVFSSILGDCTPGLGLQLSPVKFRIAWVAIFSTHVLCAAFLAGSARVYWYLTSPVMVFYVQNWAPTTRNEHYELYAVTLAFVGGFHLVRILQLTCHSIQARRLVFRPESHSVIFPTKLRMATRTQHASVRRPRHRSQGTLWSWLIHRSWRNLFSKRGFFGVESDYFLQMFVVREIVEVGSQTYQAYWSSYLLPGLLFNTVLVLLLVINCWSTPLVHQFLAAKPAQERVVVLCVDGVICIVMSVVIPSVIVAPYIASFNPSNFMFETPALVFDPLFITTFSLENQLVFATGLMDFGAKLVPHLAMFLTLNSIAELLTRQPHSTTVGISPSPVPSSFTYRSEQEIIVRDPVPWIQVAVKLIFLAWGAGLLALHLHSIFHTHSHTLVGCLAATRPWFSHRISCSTLVIDCHARGVASPGKYDFDAVESAALAALSFTHCPELRIPSAIQQLSNLQVLHIYNSTVLEWARETGGISPHAHPRMSEIVVTRSQFPFGFPEGLLQPLPVSMVSICFSITDLAELPDNLHLYWPPMASVVFEFGELQTFPSSLLSMKAFAISLRGNRLETIPELVGIAPGTVRPVFSLEGNPLKELPASLGSTDIFFDHLNLENSNLIALPAWTDKQVLRAMYMYNTPYCTERAVEHRKPNVQCYFHPERNLFVELPFQLIDELYQIT